MVNKISKFGLNTGCTMRKWAWQKRIFTEGRICKLLALPCNFKSQIPTNALVESIANPNLFGLIDGRLALQTIFLQENQTPIQYISQHLRDYLNYNYSLNKK